MIQKQRLDFLDGLRGLAILLVMTLHYWEFTWFNFRFGSLDLNFLVTTGSIGVTLFFFISGFCLYLSYGRTPVISNYVKKRFLKIFPSYILAIAAIWIFFGFPSWDWREYVWQSFTHLFFIHNWWSTTYGSINGVFWSLAVEVQFYFIFPLLFPLVKRWPVLTLALTFILAQGIRLWIYNQSPDPFDQSMNQLPPLLDIFVAGIVSAHFYSRWAQTPIDADPAQLNIRHRPRLFTNPSNATIIAALGLIASGALLHIAHINRYDIGIPQIQTWLRGGLVLSFSMLAVGSGFAWGFWNQLLVNPIFKFLSRISYNLYIWHQFIGRQLFDHKIPAYEGDPHQDLAWQPKFLIMAAGLSIAVSWAITRFFEEPILERARRDGTR